MGLFASLASWLGQNWLSAAAIATILILLIFAPGILNFLGHIIQVVYSALPTPAKAVIGLILVLLLGALIFNYTVGAQYVCLPDKTVGVVGYTEGLAYKFGVDIVGINDPLYTEKPEDSKTLVVNSENIDVTSASLGASIFNSNIQETDLSKVNVVRKDEGVAIGDKVYNALSVVVPVNEVGVYKLESIALLTTKEMMFHRKFGDLNYAIYDVCAVPGDTCVLLPRKQPIGFGTTVEYVMGEPCRQFNAPQLATGEVAKIPLASISYALVAPSDFPKDAPTDAKTPDNVYYSEGLWVGTWSYPVVVRPLSAGFFSRVWNLLIVPLVGGGTWPYADISMCKNVQSTSATIQDSLKGLYSYDPYIMELPQHGKQATGPVYNALMTPLMAGYMTDSQGNKALIPYGDAIDESNKRAQVWHDTLMQNITRYSSKNGDVIKYACTQDGKNVTMKVMGIDFFDPIVMVAIFILTGIITVYGWIMRL